MESADQAKNTQQQPITGWLEAAQEPNRLNATGIAYWAHEVDAAIVELGGDPQDTFWNKWDVGHLFAAARLARELKAAYGAAVTVSPNPKSVTVALIAQDIVVGAPVLEAPSLTPARYVYGRGRAEGHSGASGDATVIKGGDRFITISDSGTGSDTMSVTRSVNKGGRPSVLTPEAERTALELMRKRLPQEKIAARLGVSVSTIKRVARRHRH